MAKRVASILKRNVAEIREVGPRVSRHGLKKMGSFFSPKEVAPAGRRSSSPRASVRPAMKTEALAVVVLLVTSRLVDVHVVDGMSSLRLWRGDNRQSRQERSSQ